MTAPRPARESFGTKQELTTYLEHAIRDGSLMAGTRLPSERQLGADFKLSRPVVREALRGLSERGYIEIFPGRGSFVRAPEAEDLSRPLVRIARSTGVTSRNLVEARELLECAAARGAAVHASTEQVQELEATLIEHQRASTLASQATTDLAFHAKIAELSGNPVIGLMYSSIRAFVQGLMLRSLGDPTVQATGDPLHQEIFTHIRDHNPDQAEDAMRRHIGLARDLFGADFDRPLVDVLIDLGINPDEML